MPSSLPPTDGDDHAEGEDDDSDVGHENGDEVEVLDAGLDRHAELRGELGDDGEDRVEDAGRRSVGLFEM